MARRKAAATTTTSSSKAVTNYEEKLAEIAAKEAEREQAGTGQMISIRNSKFSFQGNDLGSTLDVVVLNHAFINSYYDSLYDPDNPSPPACFAIALDDDGMAPHETSPNPQGDEVNGTCVGCWANQFGSDARGRGKACKNNRRLAVIPGHDGWEESLAEPQIAYLSVPPTSLAAWRGYVNKLGKGMKKPTFAFVTRMTFDETEDYPKLQFEVLRPVDMDSIPRLIELREQTEDELLAPFSVEGYVNPEEKPATRGKAPAKKSAPRRGKGSKFSK